MGHFRAEREKAKETRGFPAKASFVSVCLWGSGHETAAKGEWQG